MTVGDKDCCAIKTCGHGEVWHPTCCQRRPHRFVEPLIIEGKVIVVGDKFYFNFECDKQFPNDPRGWVRCSLSGADGRNTLIVKPQGFQKFVISRDKPERFSLKVDEVRKRE